MLVLFTCHSDVHILAFSSSLKQLLIFNHISTMLYNYTYLKDQYLIRSQPHSVKDYEISRLLKHEVVKYL